MHKCTWKLKVNPAGWKGGGGHFKYSSAENQIFFPPNIIVLAGKLQSTIKNTAKIVQVVHENNINIIIQNNDILMSLNEIICCRFQIFTNRNACSLCVTVNFFEGVY